MQIVRYLNGVQLEGSMPEMRLSDKCIGSLIDRAVMRRRKLPLPENAVHGTIDTEGSGPERGTM